MKNDAVLDYPTDGSHRKPRIYKSARTILRNRQSRQAHQQTASAKNSSRFGKPESLHHSPETLKAKSLASRVGFDYHTLPPKYFSFYFVFAWSLGCFRNSKGIGAFLIALATGSHCPLRRSSLLAVRAEHPYYSARKTRRLIF